jgi:23S rRNA pseudouridine955/2504/2580 synthase
MKLFQDKKIQKKYIALVAGKPQETSGILKMYIKKNTVGSVEKMSEDSDGKESITEYRVIKNFSDKASLVEFSPITGRMHQIRIHASECLRCPIIGDTKYGGKKSILQTIRNSRELHLAAIEIFIPNIHGKKYYIECPMPYHLSHSIEELTTPIF